MAVRPQHLTLRAYQVGFGDCFLLSFRYRPSEGIEDRHMLIDFGSTGQPATAGDKLLLRVAEDIKKACGGKLHAVVATHRHKDHISGFATNKEGTASGDIIASLEPEVVIQPWTEDPKAQPDATHATRTFTKDDRALTASLLNMHAFSQSALDEVARRGQTFGVMARSQLEFLGEDNLSNKSAIENLMRMGQKGKSVYVNFGSDPELADVFPGVKTTVLGPPTLDQSDAIRKQRSRDASEFWHIQAAAGQSFTATGAAPFDEQFHAAERPGYTRWFLPRMDALRGDQLLEIVRSLDDQMNNTSVILLFEAGDKKLLFPGDAQIENWSYALEQAARKPALRKKLEAVNLYKVGHHGSLNATPKSLWNLFDHKGPASSKNRLQTVISTMAGKHGSVRSGTEVPRSKLVDELKQNSDYVTTQSLKRNDLCQTIEMDIN